LIGVVAVLGIAWVVSERVEGRTPSFVGALKKALPRWLPAIGTNLLMGLTVGFLTLLLIVPGIIYAGYYAFAIYAVALRGCGGNQALDYSKALVKGRWWRVVGKTAGLFLPALIPMVMVAVPMAFAPESRFLTILTETLNDVFLAYFSVGATLFFLNLDAMERKTPPGATPLETAK
jgi:hypothetical protein